MATAGHAPISCASCEACCCRLEVLLMAGDDIPLRLVAENPWGGQVMARMEDGWCAALDRNTMLCRIYEHRPWICRDYQAGDSDCLRQRTRMKTHSVVAASKVV
jgi:Fe-S-cluster containining protein